MKSEQDNTACGTPGAKCNCGPGIGRREFFRAAGAGFVAAPIAGAMMAGPFSAVDAASGHLIPEDKRLSAEWLRSLYERGAKEVFSGASLETIGMPCGGIGAGQLYLCGDGTLGCWQIFNDATSNWVDVTFATYAHRGIAKPVDQGFGMVITPKDGSALFKPLSRDGFAGVAFQGEYPIGTVRYSEPECPVKVEMEAFSPFIPLNASDSALPATLFRITAENVSPQPLRAAVLGCLQNAVCNAYAREYDAARSTTFHAGEGYTLCLHSAKALPESASARAVAAQRPAVVFSDFEGAGYGAWTAEGNAFGIQPATPKEGRVSGNEGARLACSSSQGDGPQGTLLSPSFVISRDYINFLIGGGFHPGRVSMHLEVDGQAVRTSHAHNTKEMSWRTWAVGAWEGREARLVIKDQMSMLLGHIAIDQIEFSDTPRAEKRPISEAPDFGTMALACADAADSSVALSGPLPPGLPVAEFLAGDSADYTTGDMRRGVLRTVDVELAPGEKHTFDFALTWHFPNQINGDVFAVTPWDVAHGAVGHHYAQRFADAADVASYVFRNHARLSGETRRWRDAYYDSSLPYWLLDRVHSTVSCLATGTSQWWKNGRFWAYEGVTCCHGTCAHVWNYAHTHARLFPELARTVCEMQDFSPREQGGGFHPDTGLVGFRGNEQYAADGQCGTILKAYREHLMSTDSVFLKRNWPAIKQALEFAIAQDGNADGLIENLQHNTYDINYFGANTLVGALYLAALRASEEMALETGDEAFARRVRAIFESGAKLTEARLWNGEYYTQDVDLEKYPQHQYKDGCLSDQVFGQGWAHQVGLGYLYSQAHVVGALESIWKYNWAPDIGPYNELHKPFRWFVTPGEAGLITCTWPKSAHMPEGTRYAEEVWTGIEYQVAAHMIWEGKVTEGLAICRAVHDRYHPDRFNPYNEVECGDHYARAMASWGVHLALAGFEYHGPRGWLGFAPRITPENYKALFTTAEAWVTLAQVQSESEQRNTVAVRQGALQLNRLSLRTRGPAKSVEMLLRGGKVAADTESQGDALAMTFPDGIRLEQDDALEVRTRT
ncbi:MAG: hypothetical protein HYV27_20075 [Candidatus Hydrogenedentes bacterium]|nr:hypothetical protein [Candidatus Hydrogenedentota bacterium]